MFGLFKKKATDLDLEVALAEVAQAEQATRSLARKLLKAQEENDRVLKRMASDLADALARIKVLEESLDHVNSDIQRIDAFNEAIAEMVTDDSTQMTKHYRQIAGLWSRVEKLSPAGAAHA